MTLPSLHIIFRIFLIFSITGQTANAVMVKNTIFITDFGTVPDSRLNATRAGVRAFDSCTGVTISGNKFSGEVPGKTVELQNMKKSSVSLSKDDPYKIPR